MTAALERCSAKSTRSRCKRAIEFMEEMGSVNRIFKHLQPTHAVQIVRTFKDDKSQWSLWAERCERERLRLPQFCKGFTPSEAVKIGEALGEIERDSAKERMIQAHASPGNLPEQDEGQSRDQVAACVGMGGRTYEKAKAVVEAAEHVAAKGVRS